MSSPLLPPLEPRGGRTTAFTLFSSEQRSRVATNISGGPKAIMQAIQNEFRALEPDDLKDLETRAEQASKTFEDAMARYKEKYQRYQQEAMQRAASASAGSLDVDMSTARSRLEHMVADLRANPRVEVVKCTMGCGLDEVQMEKAKALAGGPIPSDMEAFYRQVSYFSLEWKLVDPGLIADGDMAHGGYVSILPLGPGLCNHPSATTSGKDDNSGTSNIGTALASEVMTVFGDWEGSIWFSGQEDTVALYKQIRPFDHFVPEACAALYPASPPTAHRPPSVHFHYCGECLVNLNIGFGEYIALLLASRGSWYWLTALSFATAGRAEARRFMEQLPRLFPDVNPDIFLPRHLGVMYGTE